MQNPRRKDFEKFYNTHIDKVYRFVFFRVGYDKTLAEDLISEIFMKALEHFASYDPKISRSAWIITIAKNHLANYWRDRRQISGLPEEETEGGDSFWLDMAAKMHASSQLKREAYEFLEKLDANSREIVTFHYIFGYSYSEIAEMRGMTETAVKVASHRALRKMGKTN